MSNIYEKLEALQEEFKAPKTEYNSHGGFKFRSIEKMLETLKPLLKKHKTVLVFKDTLENCADTPHVTAHAILINLEDTKETVEATASAQEAAVQKGMQAAQISGSTSSYARKYALSALLLVDDNDDPDRKEGDQTDWEAEIQRVKDLKQLMGLWKNMDGQAKKMYTDALSAKKLELVDAAGV